MSSVADMAPLGMSDEEWAESNERRRASSLHGIAERLEVLAATIPDHAALLNEAAEALRTAQDDIWESWGDDN